MDERLRLHPPLQFIGAYSSLEMANGETIVSTGVAPDVLISLGDIQFRSTLTAVPMMEGFDMILGKDWLDMVNPLVDWRSNTVYIQFGDQLHRVSGIPAEEVKPCGIKDRGLAGLKDNFSQLHKECDTCLNFGKWGETYAQLASPTFWEYQPSVAPWTPGPTRTLAQPQGEVTPPASTTPEIFCNSLADNATILKPDTKKSRQNDKKLDFISLKKTIKVAQSLDTPVLLAVVRPITNEDMPKTKKKSKTKIRAGAAHGMTQGEKRRMLKESGPAKDTTTVNDTMKEMVAKADRAVKGELSRVLEEYGDIFPEKLPYGPPPKRLIDHEIEVVPGSEPPHKSPYRLSNAEMEELRNQVETLLEQGWIRPSSSPYGAPVIFVPKKNGQWRMCIDYRALNKITVKNRYPLPRIEELLDRLHGARYFSKIDLHSGYHQIRVRESDIAKTAFVTRYGSFEYLVMPFGLCNAPATFQRIMNTILRDGLDRFVLVFLDDILIFSRTKEEHEKHIRAVLNRLREEKFFGRLKKCDFYKTEVEYLGFDVGAYGVKPSFSKVQAVAEWPVPTSVKDVRSFLGLASFYRKFIRFFSEIAAPLTDLTKKGRAEVWSPEVWGVKEDEAFRRLKIAMITAPVLQLPDFDREFTVTTDASEVSVGAILQQNFGKGLQPICYDSRKLNPAECRYSAYERELLGIVWAVGKWRHYLAGAHFTIQTDHDSLKNLPNQPAVNRRVWKWVQVLQGYDCDIVHIAGKSNPADFLSRRSVKELRSMVDVRALEESMVQRLRLGDGQITDEMIQDKLDDIFKGQAGKVNSLHSLNSLSKIFVTRSKISLEPQLRKAILTGLENDTRWSDILSTLQSDKDQKVLKQGKTNFRLAHGFLQMQNVTAQDESWKVVIPNDPSIKRTILEEIHSVPYAGHLGYQKTLKKIQNSFYWTDLILDVRDYVLGCPVCQQEKSVNKLPAGLLEPLTLPEQKWADVSMDFIMGLPRTDSGNDGILTVVDRATKMVHLVPVKQTITASETAQIYWQNVGKIHGLPRSIVSDRDPRFVSRFWQGLWELLGTKLRMSSAYHPQTDGQSEAMNRVVEMILRCLLHEERTYEDWERLLSMVEFVINSSPAQSTGYTPFFLNFGYHPCTPVDILRDSEESTVETVKQFSLRMQRAFSRAQFHLNRAQERQKLQADRRRREQQFHVGDQVLLSTNNLHMKQVPAAKLKAKFVGPFFVHRCIGPVAYELELPENWKIHPVFHTSLLRPFKVTTWSQAKESAMEEVELEEDERSYEIEKILRWRYTGPSRRRKRQREFLILWRNYSIDDASWIPEANFDNPEDIPMMMKRDNPTEDCVG